VGKHDPEVQAHMRAFGTYTARLVADNASTCDDLISHMIAMKEEGDRLTKRKMLSTITLLIFLLATNHLELDRPGT